MEVDQPALDVLPPPPPPGLHDQVRLRLWPLVRRRLHGGGFDISPPQDDVGEALRLAIVLPAPTDIIRGLLQANPTDVTLASSSAPNTPDATARRNRCSPLHIAAMRFSATTVVDAMLARNSDWCVSADAFRRSPLHILCLSITNQGVNRVAGDRRENIYHLIRCILDCHPEAASLVDGKGNTPLHRIACWQRLDLYVMSERIAKSLLAAAQPAAARAINRAGRDPLLHAIHFRAPWRVVWAIIENCPESVTEYKGKLPILTLLLRNWYHRDQASSLDGADGYNESLLMPRETLMQHHESNDVRCRENGHFNPCAIATEIIGCFASDDIRENFEWMISNPGLCPKLILRFLYCRNTDVLKVRSPSNGNFILHTIASTPPVDEAAAERVEPHPISEGAKAVCQLGEIAEIYPEAARKTNNDGKLPLRLAIESGRRWTSGLRALVKANPTALLYESIPLGALPRAFEKVVQEDDLSFTFHLVKETIGGILGSCDESSCMILSPTRTNSGRKRQRPRTPRKSSAKRLFSPPRNDNEQKK